MSSELHLDRIDAAIVDLDGVVTDTAATHAAAWADLFDAFLTTTPPAARFDPEADYLRYVDGKPRTDGVVSFLASRGITVPTGDPDDPSTAVSVFGLGKRKDELFHARLQRDGVRPFPGTIAFLRQIRAAGMPIAVVSASRNCRDVLTAAGVISLFDVIVDGIAAADLGLPGKPDPATFLCAAARLGSAPERTVLVEDAAVGIEAARRGGFHPIIAVDRHHRAEVLRRAGADIVVPDLAEITVLTDEYHAGWSVVRYDTAVIADSRSTDALLALGNGTIGARGDLETGAAGRGWLTLVAGAFGMGADGDGMVRLLPGPSLTGIVAPESGVIAPAMRRTLDLRCGVLECRPTAGSHGVTTARFVSLARPGLVVVRAEGDPGERWTDRALEAPRLEAAEGLAAAFTYTQGELDDGATWAATKSDRAQVIAVAGQRSGADETGAWIERLVAFSSGAGDTRGEVVEVFSSAVQSGFDTLLTEHHREWSRRWDAADIQIDGDDAAQTAIRFALFHLLSCAKTSGEAGVGARGLSGLAYAGHVFWDADVFVLPVLAATLPDAARAMIEYRAARLPAARRRAASRGLDGACFPWESADSGDDVTPVSVRDHEGDVVAILTGSHEEHITADVAWATLHYVDWTGDSQILDGAAAARSARGHPRQRRGDRGASRDAPPRRRRHHRVTRLPFRYCAKVLGPGRPCRPKLGDRIPRPLV